MTSNPLVRYKNFVFDSSRWDGFRFRDGDIVITTPPKCGTTWLQRICALLVFQTPELKEPLTKVSPWIDMLTRPKADVFADLEKQQHRRFIKSHTPLDGLPYDPRVTYLCVGRDPRDVALSWDSHMMNANMVALLEARDAAVGNADIAEQLAEGFPPPPESERERFWIWVDNPAPVNETGSSLSATLNHLLSYWKARDRGNVEMLHFADLKRDLGGQMRALAARLGIEISQERWAALIEAASFEEMKRNADKVAPGVTESIWQNNAQFFHSGSSGQWQRLFEAGDEARYDARVRELAEPGFAAWAHYGAAEGARERD